MSPEDKLIAIEELNNALDKPFDEGRKILESYGWNYENRFFSPATSFVKFKINTIIKGI